MFYLGIPRNHRRGEKMLSTLHDKRHENRRNDVRKGRSEGRFHPYGFLRFKGKHSPFFRKSSFIFVEEIADSKQDIPKVVIKQSPHIFVIMELAEAGFGSPGVLMQERVDLICEAHDYFTFKRKFENQAYLIRDRKNAIR